MPPQLPAYQFALLAACTLAYAGMAAVVLGLSRHGSTLTTLSSLPGT